MLVTPSGITTSVALPVYFVRTPWSLIWNPFSSAAAFSTVCPYVWYVICGSPEHANTTAIPKHNNLLHFMMSTPLSHIVCYNYENPKNGILISYIIVRLSIFFKHSQMQMPKINRVEEIYSPTRCAGRMQLCCWFPYRPCAAKTEQKTEVLFRSIFATLCAYPKSQPDNCFILGLICRQIRRNSSDRSEPLRIQPFKIASQWAGCLLPSVFCTVSAENAQTCLNCYNCYTISTILKSYLEFPQNVIPKWIQLPKAPICRIFWYCRMTVYEAEAL